MSVLGNFFDKIKKDICGEFEYETVTRNFFKIYTPFTFEDGDNITIGVQHSSKLNENWKFTDGSDTFLHLSYHFGSFDYYQGPRREIIDSYLDKYETVEQNGELTKEFKSKEFSSSFFNFLQAILQISNIVIMDYEKVERTFKADLTKKITQFISTKRFDVKNDLVFGYYDILDKKQVYKIDCLIRTPQKPIYIFAIGSKYTCQSAIISILTLEKLGAKFYSIGFFKDQSVIPNKMNIQLTDTVEKSISSLDSFSRFEQYINGLII